MLPICLFLGGSIEKVAFWSVKVKAGNDESYQIFKSPNWVNLPRKLMPYESERSKKVTYYKWVGLARIT